VGSAPNSAHVGLGVLSSVLLSDVAVIVNLDRELFVFAFLDEGREVRGTWGILGQEACLSFSLQPSYSGARIAVRDLQR